MKLVNLSGLNLRWRLTLFYGAVLAAVLLAVGISVFLAVRASVHQTIDDGLRDATVLASTQFFGDEGKPQLETEVDRFETRLPGAIVLLVYGTNGKLTHQFGTTKIKFPLEAGFASVGDVRIFTEQFPERGWVQAIRSEVETFGVLRRIQRLMLIGLPLFLIVGLGGGYLLADRALRPVDQVSRLASSIAQSGRYQDRVPEAPGQDEMTRLTQTVNAMLAKLETTIERERAFALAAAHELRTPLALLRGEASLMLKRERTPEEYRQGFREVDQTSLEMTGLVESLLALARTNQPPQKQATNLEDLAVEVIENLSGAARARAINLVLETNSSPTRGDPATLRLMVSNLVGNAIKYGRDGGHVWVRTSTQNGHALLEVSDDGPGVPEADLERLMQPFQRGLGLQGVGGTGLGLALVNAVVEQHGGRFELSQASGGGLSAVATLPVALPSDRLEHTIHG